MSNREIEKLKKIITTDGKIIEDQAKKIHELEIQVVNLLSDKIDKSLLNMTGQTEKLQKATELLKECSKELFINGDNVALEEEIDTFMIEEMGENLLCANNCSNCEQCPSTLKIQAD